MVRLVLRHKYVLIHLPHNCTHFRIISHACAHAHVRTQDRSHLTMQLYHTFSTLFLQLRHMALCCSDNCYAHHQNNAMHSKYTTHKLQWKNIGKFWMIILQTDNLLLVHVVTVMVDEEHDNANTVARQ